jgi:DNA-binding NarL/FixJ family response regulator
MGQRARVVMAAAAIRTRRVLIIDDHPLIRQGLCRLISSGHRFVVCGEAGNATDGLKLIRELQPELVIVDIGLPDQDGIDLTRQIVSAFPQSHVLILSMHDDNDYAARALKAGATGYMVKSDAAEQIEVALEEVWNGRRYLSESIARQIVSA